MGTVSHHIREAFANTITTEGFEEFVGFVGDSMVAAARAAH
jgi:hypothetical protein